MPLCYNRFPLPGSPSTCVLDTILIPIPSFLFLIALSIVLLYDQRNTKLLLRSTFPTLRWLWISYFILVLAASLMSILELVRLGLEDLGLGLLPLTTFTLGLVMWRIAAAGSMTKKRKPSPSFAGKEQEDVEFPTGGRSINEIIILTAYWFLLAIFSLIKSFRLHQLELLDPNTIKTSKYPNSDWFLDVTVSTALYFLFFCFELTGLVMIKFALNRGTEGVVLIHHGGV